MSGIQRYVPTSSHGGMIRVEVHVESQSDGTYVTYADHAAEIAQLRAELEKVRGYEVAPLEAKVADLRAEADALRAIISPFAEYERVRSAMGGNSPKQGILLGVHSSAGSAELSVEDFKAAQAAMGADA